MKLNYSRRMLKKQTRKVLEAARILTRTTFNSWGGFITWSSAAKNWRWANQTRDFFIQNFGRFLRCFACRLYHSCFYLHSDQGSLKPKAVSNIPTSLYFIKFSVIHHQSYCPKFVRLHFIQICLPLALSGTIWLWSWSVFVRGNRFDEMGRYVARHMRYVCFLAASAVAETSRIIPNNSQHFLKFQMISPSKVICKNYTSNRLINNLSETFWNVPGRFAQ